MRLIPEYSPSRAARRTGVDSRNAGAHWQRHVADHAVRSPADGTTGSGSSCDRHRRRNRPHALKAPLRTANAQRLSRLAAAPTIFYRSSRSAEASSIWSAISFFSFALSSSRAFRRLASDTSIPPYFAFQLYSVASLTPCRQGRSPALAPASCSQST